MELLVIEYIFQNNGTSVSLHFSCMIFNRYMYPKFVHLNCIWMNYISWLVLKYIFSYTLRMQRRYS